jgi:hypothetical protein
LPQETGDSKRLILRNNEALNRHPLRISPVHHLQTADSVSRINVRHWRFTYCWISRPQFPAR